MNTTGSINGIVHAVNRKGSRVNVDNHWYTLPLSHVGSIRPGERIAGTVQGSRIYNLNPKSVKADEINLLYSEIDRLNKLLECAGIDPRHPVGIVFRNPDDAREVEYGYELEQFWESNEGKRMKSAYLTDWIEYTNDPGAVRLLMHQIDRGKLDRFKNGRDAYSRIADYCENVPWGLLPDSVKDHIQGGETC